MVLGQVLLELRALAVFSFCLAVASCGKTGANFTEVGAGSDGGAEAKAGSSTASGGVAMTSGGVAMTSGGVAMTSGGSAKGGSAGAGSGGSGSAGSAGGGGTAGVALGGAGSAAVPVGEGGAGGEEAPLGVDCRGTHCATGDVCVSCGMPDGTEWRCAPHPVREPDAYEQALASCELVPLGYNECDGPEDCAPDQYCVAREGSDERQRCRSMPAPGYCCFTCNALVNCTLCRKDSDCPDGEGCDVVFENLKGCRKR